MSPSNDILIEFAEQVKYLDVLLHSSLKDDDIQKQAKKFSIANKFKGFFSVSCCPYSVCQLNVRQPTVVQVQITTSITFCMAQVHITHILFCITSHKKNVFVRIKLPILSEHLMP